MKLSTFLIIAAVAYAGFGLGLLAVPTPFMFVYGVSLDNGGALMARILGSALLGFTLIFWWCRNSASSDALQAIIRASFIYNVVDLPVVFIATLTGVMGPLGWIPVILHLLLALGFGYFGFMKR
jgi:hypothetical protein